mmetsp:Transcript_29936/g.65486  ORF Transcript_29936/g.65486 Transcript_29936/m.65486 type:complete len:237 (-) Transcript_29936:640-1350(-)
MGTHWSAGSSSRARRSTSRPSPDARPSADARGSKLVQAACPQRWSRRRHRTRLCSGPVRVNHCDVRSRPRRRCHVSRACRALVTRPAHRLPRPARPFTSFASSMPTPAGVGAKVRLPRLRSLEPRRRWRRRRRLTSPLAMPTRRRGHQSARGAINRRRLRFTRRWRHFRTWAERQSPLRLLHRLRLPKRLTSRRRLSHSRPKSTTSNTRRTSRRQSTIPLGIARRATHRSARRLIR